MQQKQLTVSMLFLWMSILFCVCLILSNVLETKQIAIGSITITGGLLVFPISYIINDCVCEVWGYPKARLLIWIGFMMNFFFVAMCAVCDFLPGAPYWDNDAGFHAIFGLAPRIAVASFIAFLTGSFINAYVMSTMKLSSHGKHFSVRAIASTVLGESADSVIFFPMALWGVIPTNEMFYLMISQVILKTVYEIIALPVTIRLVKLMKRHEHTDVYDEQVDYNILKILNI